jgi:exodeoxyribonuclease-3
MRIATWNVNSIRQRLDHLLTWLKDCAPDIVCLQEIKCVDEAFPRRDRGARLQRRHPWPEDLQRRGAAVETAVRRDQIGLAGDDEDVHARFLEGVVSLKRGVLRVACLYLPNGNPPDTDKYPYKLKWMSRLLEYSRSG